MGSLNIQVRELRRLLADVAQIKAFLLPVVEDDEGPLSDWARKELEEARRRPEEEYASLEDVRERILMGR